MNSSDRRKKADKPRKHTSSGFSGEGKKTDNSNEKVLTEADLKDFHRFERPSRPGARSFQDSSKGKEVKKASGIGSKSSSAQKVKNDKDGAGEEVFVSERLSSKTDSWRLNKFIANSGICSRREADTLIADGKVTVNGKVVTEMGVKVSSKDKVTVDGAEIHPENFVYILLNKPKGYITTTDDERDRNTVMDLVKDATGLRVYPVGRLDRQTTGLLLLTNDGDLANRLMHPRYEVRKVYEVETNKPLEDEQIQSLLSGITLDDGPAKAYNVKRVAGFPNVIQLSIFEGRNRQVRRMFEFFGIEVTKLNRTIYAGLNTRGVRVGRWRFLRDDEVNDLRTLVKLFDVKKKSDTTRRNEAKLEKKFVTTRKPISSKSLKSNETARPSGKKNFKKKKS